MKKLAVLFTVMMAYAAGTFAQQVPMYSFYYYNPFIYNPALAGAKNYGQVYLINRNQWNSIPEAPKTLAATIDGPLKKKNIGLGFGIYRDQAAQFNITGGQVAYRYGIDLDNDQNLSFGLSLGFINNAINFAGIIARDDDPVVVNGLQNKTGFDANFGVNYRRQGLNVGVTVPQILSNELAYQSVVNSVNADQVTYALRRHIIGNVSYEIALQEGKWNLTPMALVRAVPGAPFQYDINVMFDYMKKYWIGAMWRSQYAATFSGGLKLAEQFVAGYAYDMAIANGTVSTYLRGAHEVMVGYQFGSSDEVEKLKKKVNEMSDQVEKNKNDIDDVNKRVKKNRDDIDANDKDIEDLKGMKGDLDKLKSDFDDFKKKVENEGMGGLKVGEKYGFKNVYFETNSYVLSNVARAELDNMVQIMKDNPTLKIEVGGHTDERGSDEYNLRLSQRRSRAVRDYMTSKGIDAQRISTAYYGETVPANGDLAQNRRVEFRVTAK